MKRLALLLLLLAAPAHATTITSPGTYHGPFTGDLNIENTHDVIIEGGGAVVGSLSIQHCINVAVHRCVIDGDHLNLDKWTLSKGSNYEISDCTMILGRGCTDPNHIWMTWNLDGLKLYRNKIDVTLEANGPIDVGAVWFFDTRHIDSRNNRYDIHTKRHCYAVFRYRGNQGIDVGCFGNTFDHDSVYVDGLGDRILLSSSADCGNSGTFLPQCVGHWDATFNACIFDISKCPTGTIQWQGGVRGVNARGCTFASSDGPAWQGFEYVGSDVSDCTFKGSVLHYVDSGRPSAQGGLNWCRNTVTGSLVNKQPAGVVTSNCSVIPPTPVPVDTLRLTIKAAPPVSLTVSKVPAIITVVKP